MLVVEILLTPWADLVFVAMNQTQKGTGEGQKRHRQEKGRYFAHRILLASKYCIHQVFVRKTNSVSVTDVLHQQGLPYSQIWLEGYWLIETDTVGIKEFHCCISHISFGWMFKLIVLIGKFTVICTLLLLCWTALICQRQVYKSVLLD